MDQKNIRNFCIIAHIDHGKSTLADRFLELTGTIDKRKMQEQVLDQMDLERERGITIKLAPATMTYNLQPTTYNLNLIDTPGHVDFTYEVSRSLAAVEGAVLLVDATQGVQAQTIGNLQLAKDQGLVIIPVLNKIDVVGADVDTRRLELAELLNINPDEILTASAKTGEGVDDILKAVVERVPAPSGQKDNPLRALIFDSIYDDYKGVITYVRIMDGHIRANAPIRFLGTSANTESLEVGIFKPGRFKKDEISSGEIGYIVTGLKDISKARVGDTISIQNAEIKALPGYKELPPMVYAGIFPQEGSSPDKLREALLKLKLNDAALVFEPERSSALGFGFRIGLLGMLHLEIVKERLEREHGISLVITVPSVAYRIFLTNGDQKVIKGALELPDPTFVDHIEEPYVRVKIVTPKDYVGGIMQLAEEKRAVYQNTEYLDDHRVIVVYEMPLFSIIIDFYDSLKSVSSGYASFQYELIEYRTADVVRMDMLVAEEPVEAFSLLVYRDEAEGVGRRIAKKLKDAIPRKQFEIKLQARVGGRIVASERIPSMRKDVLAKLYGGDVTRKMKLLKKQKEGKKRMKAHGRGEVEIPPKAYLAVLKRD